jgi:hypothetical protein
VRSRTTRAAAVGFALLALAPVLPASPHSVIGFKVLDDVPAWVVCTVTQVVGFDEIPPGRRIHPWAERRFRAHVLVRRAAFSTAARPFEPGDRITIQYVDPEGPLPGGGGGYGPPFILNLQKGQTILVPLTHKNHEWSVTSDFFPEPRVAALAGEPGFGRAPLTGKEFVFRELSHVLAHGDALEKARAARFLMTFGGEVPAELPRLLMAAFAGRDDVWLEAGCAFLGNLGVPRNTADFVYGEASPPFSGVSRMITWILWKGDRRDYPNRLIRALLRNADTYAWGAAMTLVDFKDSTVLIDELNAAMKRNAGGSLTIAYFVIKAGQRAVLPEALEMAQRVLSRADAAHEDLMPAAQLILNYGDDRQFAGLAATLARLKHENENRYRELWGTVGYGQNPRELRLAAILIDDRRPGFGTLRYCDVAAGVVQRLSGVKLGVSQEMTPQERDAAVARAAVWLAAH